MQNRLLIAAIAMISIVSCASYLSGNSASEYDIAMLRKLYSSGDQKLWPKPDVHPLAQESFQDIGHLPEIKFPSDNANSPAKINLGKILFYDPRLSGSGQIACATCHDPQLGWGDGKRVAFGHNRQVGKRNAMTLWNTAYYDKLFWDGRAVSLEDQAQRPVMDVLEMHEDLESMETKVKSYKGYTLLFKEAFGVEEINLDKIFKAIACFERTIVSPKSRFDLFIDGKEEAMTDQEVLGLHLFRTKAGCINCHNGGLFADNQFHNDGQTLFASANEDLGRYNVTKKAADVGKFKTPSLREVVNTGPWMHHGNFPTLKDVLFFYNLGNPAPVPKSYKGDRDSLLPVTSPMLRRLNLNNEEIDAVIAFLGAITTTPRRLNPPTQFPQ